MSTKKISKQNRQHKKTKYWTVIKPGELIPIEDYIKSRLDITYPVSSQYLKKEILRIAMSGNMADETRAELKEDILKERLDLDLSELRHKFN